MLHQVHQRLEVEVATSVGLDKSLYEDAATVNVIVLAAELDQRLGIVAREEVELLAAEGEGLRLAQVHGQCVQVDVCKCKGQVRLRLGDVLEAGCALGMILYGVGHQKCPLNVHFEVRAYEFFGLLAAIQIELGAELKQGRLLGKEVQRLGAL